MKNNILTLLLFMITATVTKAIEPKVIRAHDSTYRSDRATTHRGSSRRDTQDDILLSTIEASSEISVQITSAISLEASTQATSQEPQQQRRGRRYSQLKFLKNNRVHIKQDIAQGRGEYLSTLLDMMSIESTKSTLFKIQSNFEKLSSLEDREFLSTLVDIINS